MATNTPNLNLMRVQETWQFADEAFNRILDDADLKLVGVAHLDSPKHWTDWKANTAYVKDDVVRISDGETHQYYQCLVGGTSGTVEPTNNITGSVVTDNTITWEVKSLTESGISGGTLKIWLSGSYYHRGDAVLYGTALYRCKTDHSATNWNADYIYWQEILSSVRFWKPLIYYFADDTVIYEDLIYKCITAHTSEASFTATEEVNWEIIGGAGGSKDWISSEKYIVGQLVLYNGTVYRCNTKHTSGASFDLDESKWDLVNAQIENWTPSSYYRVGMLAAYNNIVYKCVTAHTSDSTDFKVDLDKWILYHNPIEIWDTNKSYYLGQVVLYEGNANNFRMLRCNTTHVSTTFASDRNNWDSLNASIPIWRSNTYYKIGDTALYDNELFKCVLDHTSSSSSPASIYDDITDDPATTCWVQIVVKNSYVGDWEPNKVYNKYQLVMNGNTLYRCTNTHTSSATFVTDKATKWEAINDTVSLKDWVASKSYETDNAVVVSNTNGIPEWDNSSTYAAGDRVTHIGYIYECITPNSDTTFVDSHWQFIEPVYNRIYRCLTDNNDSTFDDSKWQLLDGNSKAKKEDVLKLLS